MQKKAFTLIELLLVVVIIGAVYGLVIGSMKEITDKEKHLDFLSLPAFLKQMHQNNHIALTCIDDCRSCALYIDGEKTRDIPPFMRDERTLRFWRFDANLGTQELRFTPLFDEDNREFDVCFNYEIFEDGSSSEMIIETKEYSYDYRGLTREVERHNSLQALEESRQIELQEVLQ